MRGVLRVTGPSREFVVPTTVIAEDPGDVLRDALIERVTVAGAPTEGETVGGANWQLAPAGKPLQERVTAPANDPKAETDRLTGWELVPRGRVTVEGAAAATVKSTTFTCTGCLCAVALESEPVPRMLNEKS